jgi:acyl-CoA dehydrogenase
MENPFPIQWSCRIHSPGPTGKDLRPPWAADGALPGEAPRGTLGSGTFAPDPMPDRSFLSWPFLDDAHRELAERLDEWAGRTSPGWPHGKGDVDDATRALVRLLGEAGWLRHAVPATYGGASERLEVRSLCLIRETLARHAGLADFAFAMQGLGSGPISLFGSEEQKRRYLPPVAAGEKIAAFAISEPEAGSDVAAMRTAARRDGDGYVIDGTKTWISNGGIADHYVVFCRFPECGEKGYAAFVVEAGNPGLRVAERIEVIAPHPLATLKFTGCRVPREARIGEEGAGLKVALGTLDVFRSTVGAAALGFARRALDEAVEWVRQRQAFGKALSEHQLTQARLADMAVAVDTSALLVYRAAWARDTGAERITREAAMAKLHATEAAQQVIDSAVQLLGGRGVVAGAAVETLYREIRALRIYEGTSEIQKLVIAGQVLREPG